MNWYDVITFDWETLAIKPRPNYPPSPAGLAVMWPGEAPKYMAFGHPVENNCSRGDVQEELEKMWASGLPLLGHNLAFDLSVCYERCGMPNLPWQRAHDTLYLIFLHSPHAKNLQLKSSAEEILGWAPEEQSAVNDWIWTHRHDLERQTGEKVKKSELGAWIAYAPGDLVGRYAIGDVKRTLALFAHLYPLIVSKGMLEAYDRERRVMPILLENERRGLRIDLPMLQKDLPVYEEALIRVEDQMRLRLGAPGLSFDNDDDIAGVFMHRKAIKEDRWVLTGKSKKLSVSKDNLPPDAFEDPLLASAFGYRNRLWTCLQFFMRPWDEMASQNLGYVHTSWNQVRNERGGTRTGRPSMSKPNLLNVSKDWKKAITEDGYVHPEALNLPALPITRMYILPDSDQVFLHRDFAGQELRIFAHFESGELYQAYQEDPRIDPHEMVGQKMFEATGRYFDRTAVKAVNFQALYGGGIPAVQAKLKLSYAAAQEFKTYHDRALPGRSILVKELQKEVRLGNPIRTWGGRLYYVEPPSESKKYKRIMNYEYKLINYLIQGSAADVTKEALCRWYYGGGPSNGSRFLLTVYDEINVSSPVAAERESMEFLRECMEGIELDVKLLSDGKRGERWGALEKCE